jgi:aminoglycoside phosphotransferase (APT) family kinase protein
MSPAGSLPDALRAFAERELGEPLAHVERVGAGASRVTWLLRSASGEERVLRVDTGDGPVAGTELSLAREAAAYRALRGSGVRIPALIAAREEALMVERAPGSPELDGLPAPQRAALMLDYAEALAELHGVDAATARAHRGTTRARRSRSGVASSRRACAAPPRSRASRSAGWSATPPTAPPPCCVTETSAPATSCTTVRA